MVTRNDGIHAEPGMLSAVLAAILDTFRHD
jgi:hypothetical protein